jgi:hypothetical protein
MVHPEWSSIFLFCIAAVLVSSTFADSFNERNWGLLSVIFVYIESVKINLGVLIQW